MSNEVDFCLRKCCMNELSELLSPLRDATSGAEARERYFQSLGPQRFADTAEINDRFPAGDFDGLKAKQAMDQN